MSTLSICRRFILLILAVQNCLALSSTGIAQAGGIGDLQYRHKGDAYKDSFGQACVFLGDINGDGLADYAVGADEYDSLGITNTGLVRVFSGADGSVIHEIFGSERIELLGRYLGLAGDVNADGTLDFLVAAYGKQRVDVYSGNDATKLLEIASPFSGVGFGISLQRLGDINLDGHDDFVIGSPDVATALGVQTGWHLSTLAQMALSFSASKALSHEGNSVATSELFQITTGINFPIYLLQASLRMYRVIRALARCASSQVRAVQFCLSS